MGGPDSTRGGADGYRPGYEVVAERILELVATQGLRPGDYLGTETQLAERLAVSRTVTREAVKVLSAVGRVRSRKGSGLFVADQEGFTTGVEFFLPADVEHVRMLFEFRVVQEEAAVRLAAVRATPPDLRACAEAAEETKAAVVAGDAKAFGQWDDAFHLRLTEAAHNRFLTSSVTLARRLQRQAGLIGLRGTMAGSPKQAAKEHLRIFEAVSSGDPDEAAAAVRAHLDVTRNHYEQLLTRYLSLELQAKVDESVVTSS